MPNTKGAIPEQLIPKASANISKLEEKLSFWENWGVKGINPNVSYGVTKQKAKTKVSNLNRMRTQQSLKGRVKSIKHTRAKLYKGRRVNLHILT